MAEVLYPSELMQHYIGPVYLVAQRGNPLRAGIPPSRDAVVRGELGQLPRVDLSIIAVYRDPYTLLIDMPVNGIVTVCSGGLV
jgi:hypothetical protein